ncbi:MAG: S-methyl-5-thioribose-1-phosphate isomerase [Candidatus Undinarchaeales archaeon]
MEFKKVKETAKKIKEMEIQGAVQIALAAEKALEDFIFYSKAETRTELLSDLKKAGKILKSSRPTAVALPNAVDRFIEKVEETDIEDIDDLKRETLEIGSKIINNTKEAFENITKIGASLIKNEQIIFTHCHSSTVNSILKYAFNHGKKFEVICTETRPFGQGFITARELSEAGIPVTLIVDSAVMQNMEKVDLVLVGADTITKENKLINKIGTSQIALIAKHFDIPFYSAAQILKFTDKKAEDIELEERGEEEILEGRKLPDVNVRNVVFDITEPEYITGIITEEGIKNKSS